MNVFKKLLFQASFIGCMISGATFTSEEEQEVPIEAVQALSGLYEQTASQLDQINANLQQIIELITSKKLQVSDVEKTRQNIKEAIYFLDHQKEITTQLTPENIDHLALINKVSLEYFSDHIPHKIAAISLENLIKQLENFFAALNSGSETVGDFDEILAENDAKLAKLSYACDTAGLSNINIMYRYLEQKMYLTMQKQLL